MFRVQDGIVGDGQGAEADVAQVDSDLISTLTVIGFVAGRMSVGHSLDFSWDPREPKDQAPTVAATDKLRRATGADAKQVRATPAPDWQEGALITGAVGSAGMPFELRRAEPKGSAAQLIRYIAAKANDASAASSDDAPWYLGYQGQGAYTGLVDNPVADTGGVSSTKRFTVPEDGWGERWRPAHYAYAGTTLTQDDAPWGLIRGMLTIDTMQAEPCRAGDVVGYTHGMVQAIYDSVASGPWCTPFEIAAGSVTTKVASCIGCTLFMYAAGFPPSAIHLGRSDSWVPWYPADPQDNGTRPYSVMVDEATRSTNSRWALECQQHLELGISLARAGGFLAASHAARLDLLRRAVESRPDDLWVSANLLLDAFTVHGSMTERIRRAVRD